MIDTSRNSDRFWWLVDKRCSFPLNREEIVELDSYLTTDAALQRSYLDFCQLHTDLHLAISTQQALTKVQALIDGATKSLPVVPAPATPALVRPFRWNLSSLSLATLAVALVFYGSFALVVWTMSWGKDRSLAPFNERVANATLPVAYLAKSPLGRELGAERQADDQQKSALRAGERVTIDSGLAVVEFVDGATVVLEGPINFTLESATCGYLHRGKMVAHVPPRASGFTVQTTSATIIDRGTEFGVEVTADGVSNVAVLKGRVDVKPIARVDSQTALNSRRLVAGEAVRIDGGGNIQNRDSAENFARLSPLLPPQDNLESVLPPEGIRLWLRLDQGVERDAEGRIERWRDQSGKGFDAVQPQPQQRPLLVSETARGRGQAAAFDGVDDFLTCDHGLDISTADDMTLFLLLADIPTFADNAGVFSLRPREGKDSKSYDGLAIELDGSRSPSGINVGQGFDVLPLGADWQPMALRSNVELRWPLLLVFTKLQGTATLRINGQTLVVDRYKFTADIAKLMNTAGYTIGRRSGVGIDEFANVSVVELLIFDRAFTGRHATAIESQILERHAQSTPKE
jgi:hypothetical protein